MQAQPSAAWLRSTATARLLANLCQRLQHLTYLSQHKHLLEADQELCAALQEAVLLHDMGGKPAASAALFFPLGSQLPAALQQDMRAAGMRVLHKRYAAVPGLRNVLRLLGVSTATSAVVAEHILQLYTTPGGQQAVSEEQRTRHLAFLADKTTLLERDSSLLQQVKDSMQLQDSQGCYRPPNRLHHSLGSFASLREDMLAAGMLFLHSSYLGGVTGEQTGDGSSSTSGSTSSTTATTAAQQRLMLLLQLLGVVTPGFGVIAQHLLQLYQADGPAAAMPAEQHLRHIDFFADNIRVLQGSASLLQQVQEHVLLCDSTGCRRAATGLFFSLGADTAELQADMVGAGMRFVASTYPALSSGNDSSAAFRKLLSVLRVREPDKLAVTSYLLQLHRDTDASVITEQQRYRHLAFLADNLQAAGGGYLPAQQLWFLPGAAVADLQADLAAAGMSFVHESYSSMFGSSESSSRQMRVLQLLEQLGVQHPSSAHAAEYLKRLYEAGSREVSEQQRSRHLAFFAANTHLLQEAPDLLERLQGSLLLQDTAGSCRLAGELLFPLSPDMSNLQASMDAAGMPFLHGSCVDATAGSTSSGVGRRSSRQSLYQQLLSWVCRSPALTR